jgi:hypothetical protein
MMPVGTPSTSATTTLTSVKRADAIRLSAGQLADLVRGSTVVDAALSAGTALFVGTASLVMLFRRQR